MRSLWFTLLAGMLLSSGAAAQRDAGRPVLDQPAEFSVAIRFFAPLFLPKILQDEYRLKEYIWSDELASVRRSSGDLAAVDAMFDRAMNLSWHNVYEALLLSLVCTMEHRNFGVKLPLLGTLLWIPLTSEFPDEFQQRVGALPSRLYDDTPPDAAGDRDKLQHFFGSALITYLFESRDAAERVGAFVEWGEDKFVVGGSLDLRDIRANVQGQMFGTGLLSDPSVLPSLFFRRHEQLSWERGCVPLGEHTSVNATVEER
jgi:hypothetical protein